MKLRDALFGLSSLCGLVLPASGGRVNTRDRAPRSVPSSHIIHERHTQGHLHGWVKRELVDAEATLPVRIGLKQSNVDAGHERLMDM
jgi:tripeptidyl-peptidase-1